MNSTLKDLVRAAIDISIIYYAEDMGKNAQYIHKKLTPGSWTVYIWKNNYYEYWTVYECRHMEYWGYLSNYGTFGWSYYIVYAH